MRHSDSITNIAPDLLKAQMEMPAVLKKATGQVGKMKTKYADLENFLEIVEPVLNANNIVLLQPSKETLSGATVVTTLVHAPSGEWIKDDGFHAPSAGNGAQGVGSAATYAKRYGLAAMLGISTKDDDGAAASRPPAPARQAEAPRQVPRGVVAKPELAKLKARIDKLPEEFRAQIREDLKKAEIKWNAMSPAQLDQANGFVVEAENDANMAGAA